MSRKSHYLSMDFRRAFLGKRFIICILGVVATLFFSLEKAENMTVSVLYVFMLSTYGTGFYLSLIFCAFAYGTVFTEELENAYARYSIIRGDAKRYIAAKLITIFLSSVAVTAIACFIFPLICSFWLPWSDEETLLSFLPGVSYRVLLQQGKYMLWFVLYGLQWGIFAGCMSVAAACFSLYVSNRLLTLLAPALLYQIMRDLGTEFFVKFPYLDPGLVFDATNHLFQADGLVIGWALLIAAVFCSIIGTVCIRRIRKRM